MRHAGRVHLRGRDAQEHLHQLVAGDDRPLVPVAGQEDLYGGSQLPPPDDPRLGQALGLLARGDDRGLVEALIDQGLEVALVAI